MSAKKKAPAPTPVEITAPDVVTVLGSKVGAIVTTPTGVAAVAYPYAGHDILWTRDDVAAWVAANGGSVTRTAAALTADLAWITKEIAA